MNTQQNALSEILQKFGHNNYANIPLHRTDYTDALSLETIAIINSLPYAMDDTQVIKYNLRKCDQIINLEVWK
jgi:hypothetical protein